MFQKCMLAALLFATLSGQAIAQNAPTDSLPAPAKPRTLLHASNIRQVGIYIAPEAQYGQLGGDFTPLASHSLMLLFNQRFAIGASGGMTIDREFAPADLDAAQALQLKTGFGGLKMEYTFAPFRAVHLTVPVLIGAQMVRIDSVGSGEFFHDHDFPGRPGRGGRDAGFAFVQPGLMLEANLTSFAKIYLGASYRAALNAPDTYTVGSDSVKFSNALASGAAFSAGVKLGLFDIHRPKFARRGHHRHGRD